MEYINPAANELLPRSHNTIKARVLTLFDEGKKRIQHILQSALSDIHFTCDLWTSPNYLGLLGITAHFTAEDATLKTLTLGMREVQGHHSGENLALLVEGIIEDFLIGNRIGYFMMDNATTNDKFMRTLAQWFHESGQPYDAKQKRLRCNGHVINLAVQVFLFDNISDDIEYLEELDERQPIRVPDRDELQRWRKIGPLGKLHNIVVFICETPQSKQRFRNLEPHLLPCRDNKTRWNSWYTMLNWAITKIKPAIITFCSDEEELKDDQLSALDWKILQAIRDFLQLFYDATKATEGRDATLEYLLPSMEFLAQQFEKALIQYADNTFMLASLDAGYSKFIKYFNKAERHPAYIAAVVLNPRVKWIIFSKWDIVDRLQAKEALFELWKTDYRSNTGLPEPISTLQPESGNSFHRWLDETVALEDQTRDEMERYLANEAPISIGGISAREWWLSAPQKAQFPLLSRMAVDLLSIPAMSSEAERVFSATKKTIHQGRWSLKANTIEALKCLKSWFQAGYYTQADLHEVLRQGAAAEQSELDNIELE